MKAELEFTKKENFNLEIELTKKDKILEDIVIDTQNSIFTNLNNINDGNTHLNKTIIGKITEVFLFFFTK